MVALQIVLGLALLLGGGDGLVRGSVAVATRLGVSPLLIGLILVGFGTSTPELVASLNAALVGAPGIAVGNVVGSNIANIFLVLGAGALLRPLATTPEAFRRDSAVLVAATILTTMLVVVGSIERWMGLVGVGLLAAYTVLTALDEREAGAAVREAQAAEVLAKSMPLWAAALLTVAGIVAVLVGADMLVSGAITVAELAGLSEAVIGVTLVALGTSLPELATCVVAALRRHADVAVGNIVGSSIFNLLGILAVTAAVTPLAIPAEIAELDIWVMVVATALLVIFGVTGWRVTRWEGAILLAAYFIYIAVHFVAVVNAASP